MTGVSAFAAPVYLPSGPQQNVALSTITNGGWTQCYAHTFDVSIGNQAEGVLSVCTDDYLMMAGRVTGSDTVMELAATLRSDAIQVTGSNSTTHLSNGSQWWFANNWSWGFTDAGDTVNNFQCDTSPSPHSMCLHTIAGVGGYRIDDILGLNGSTRYEKLFFQASAGEQVPEPGSIALALTALGALGFVSRRRKS